MQKPKKYWLRGLMTGITIYVVGVLIVAIGWYSPDWGYLLGLIFAVYFWPVIIICLLIGLIIGRIKKRVSINK